MDTELSQRYRTFVEALFAVHEKVTFPALSTPTHQVALCRRCGVQPSECHVRQLARSVGLSPDAPVVRLETAGRP